MEIKAADVMKLRKMTGAGMMDCKKALMEAEGDYARAQDIIREKGKLVVAKRADRTATEGVVVTKIVGQKAYILCLACETDFVAQNAEYTASANAMLDVAVKNDAADRDALMATKNDEGRTVEEMVTEKSGQTGEKIELAYYARIEAPYCAAYVHFNKKLGTVLGFNKEVPAEVAHTVAMQATAMAPVSISEADCPAEVIEHERKIAVEAMKQDPKNANKPEAILEKIAEGKMRKFFEENTLLNQAVVGEKETIAEFIHKADPFSFLPYACSAAGRSAQGTGRNLRRATGSVSRMARVCRGGGKVLGMRFRGQAPAADSVAEMRRRRRGASDHLSGRLPKIVRQARRAASASGRQARW